ncbi:MBL fold metallo-hydrolase [Paenibacillus xylanexedens]|uniref:MBL fold metallo-hydrolase n=1 Tax=Paenibacillus xylanexedens TaxID=528191 RepID=UPI0011A46BEA|nr:MBL fold metallo-hydrolase [Paenibacillus xylanexedens]
MKRSEAITMPEYIHRVKITMSFPLRWVNSYVLSESDGTITIVDPGPRSSETELEWQEALSNLGLSFQSISQIVLTHHHPDHLGLSGWLQQKTGAPVRMSSRSMKEAEYMWGQNATINVVLPEYYGQHGMPADKTKQIHEHMESFDSQITPLPEITPIEDGEWLQMGSQRWLAVETGGHASGHLSFYSPESREILCGDAVLPQISPNVSLQPGSDTQPLLSYMEGLHRLGALDVERAYPGHRNPFLHFNERTVNLLTHHEERLQKMAERVAEAPVSAYHLCIFMFSDRLSTHQLRFAMSETLAHLQELIRRGIVVQQEQSEGMFLFNIKK